MTMTYHIVVGKKLTKKQQQQVFHSIEKIFSQTDRVYNNWNPSSEISKINQNKNHKPQLISSELRDLISCCEECYKITKKRFDPTLGSIINVWKAALIKNQLPLNTNPEAVGWGQVIVDELSLQKKHPKCQFDFCGISKGYTIDLLAKKLTDLRYNNFLIEWGGEVIAKGVHPKNRHWSVFINNLPKGADNKINLNDEAIATSGNFMLSKWSADGKSYFHIFDPISKKPLEKRDISTVTVIAPTCYLADAIATAAMTFPDLKELKKWGYEIIKEYPGISFIIVNSKDQTIERVSDESSNFF